MEKYTYSRIIDGKVEEGEDWEPVGTPARFGGKTEETGYWSVLCQRIDDGSQKPSSSKVKKESYEDSQNTGTSAKKPKRGT